MLQFKISKFCLQLFISVAILNIGNVYASVAADSDELTASSSSSSSSVQAPSTKVQAGITDEQIYAMTDAQINAVVAKISPFQMAGHLTEEEQGLAKAAQNSRKGKEYVPLKEYQLRMISVYLDKILADRGSSISAEFALSARTIKDFIQQLLPGISAVSSKVIDKIRDKALFLAEGINTSQAELKKLISSTSSDSSGSSINPLCVVVRDQVPSYIEMSVIGTFFGYAACMDAWWNNTPLAMMAVNPKETGTYQSSFSFYHHDTNAHNMEANPQKYAKDMAESKMYHLKRQAKATMATLAVKQSYTQYEMFSAIVRKYIRSVKIDLVRSFSRAEAVADEEKRLMVKKSARQLFNKRIGGLFWASHEERGNMNLAMSGTDFQSSIKALFKHRDFASAFGSQLNVILAEANELLKTFGGNTSWKDECIQNMLQFTCQDMLATLPKDLIAQYDTLVAQNNAEWEARVADLGPSALRDKNSNPFLTEDD